MADRVDRGRREERWDDRRGREDGRQAGRRRSRSRSRSFERSRGRDRDHERYADHERSRARDGERDRERRRSRSKSRDRDRKRHRSAERSPGRDEDGAGGKRRRSDAGRGVNGHGDRSDDEDDRKPGLALPPPPSVNGEVQLEAELSPEEIQMMAAMGIPFGFASTQGQFVEDEKANAGAVKIQTKRSARQYMNRKGGFNRPLPAEVTGHKVIRD